jgi:DNA-binding transcriptional MerR regulator
VKISEVIQLTGLTKKAINYYEEQELIIPDERDDNNYREYSNHNVEQLIQIATLRQMDVAIKDIKEILTSPIKLEQILNNHLLRLENNIKEMEKSRGILKTCLHGLNDNPIEISRITKDLLRLRESLDLDEKGREGYIKKQLEILFPGQFCKGIIAHYEPFLNEPIDSLSKEKAWLEIVKFLDEAENLEYPKEFDMIYENMDEEAVEKMKEGMKKFYQYSPEKLKELASEGLMKMHEKPDYGTQIQSMLKSEKVIKDKLREVGFYKIFNGNLKILSNDYRKLQENLAEFNKLMLMDFDYEGNLLIK